MRCSFEEGLVFPKTAAGVDPSGPATTPSMPSAVAHFFLPKPPLERPNAFTATATDTVTQASARAISGTRVRKLTCLG